MTPKYSVIVPVYNAEKQIRRCVDSILAQTFTDFELLLIDDGSKDASPAILKDLEGGAKIRVFSKQNGGAASARNVGLDNARGEYIVFVDADDYVCPNLLADYEAAHDADLKIQGFRMIWKSSNFDASFSRLVCRLEGDERFTAFAQWDMVFLGALWNKCYRASVIADHHLRFTTEVHDAGEDYLFNWNYFLRTNSLQVVDAVNYVYEENPHSITHGEGGNTEGLELKLKLYENLSHLMQGIGNEALRSEAMSAYYKYFSDTVLRCLYLWDIETQQRRQLLARYATFANQVAGPSARKHLPVAFDKLLHFIVRTFSVSTADSLLCTVFKLKGWLQKLKHH